LYFYGHFVYLHILRTGDIFNGHLVCFFLFGMLHREKSGNPARDRTLYFCRIGSCLHNFHVFFAAESVANGRFQAGLPDFS
jgi:hypothetical protein